MSTENALYAASCFLAALFLLTRGADLFIEHTAALSTRLHIPSVLIALLTAGAEWEELAVITFALIQHKPALALGNAVGSAISNILGAFSIGILFQTGTTQFDHSSKIYTAILVVVTTAVSVLAWAGWPASKVLGGLLIGAFCIYVALVCWSIYRRVLAAPEDVDDDDGDSDEDEEDEVTPTGAVTAEPAPNGRAIGPNAADETAPLLSTATRTTHKPRPSILHHVFKLLLGFLGLSISGYILSRSSTILASSLGISDTVFGATLLSIATTLPEKFVAVLSGARGQSGILIANTVGSNIFLLTLCLGVVLLGAQGVDRVRWVELGWLWGSAVALGGVVVVGSRRWMGVVLLVAYVVFLVLELGGFA